MSESEESLADPFEDSGSEYQPSIIGETPNDYDVDDISSDFVVESQNDGSAENEIDIQNEGVVTDSPGNTENAANSTTGTSSKKTRKRKGDPAKWKKNIRKKLRQSGHEYENCRGDTVVRKIPVRNCLNCRFKCLDNFSLEDVELIHKDFWSNSDSEKAYFYDKTTERFFIERKRNRNLRQRTKTYSFKYFFEKNNNKIRVCKRFYLGVLSISQIRISYFHSHKRKGITGTPQSDKRGSDTKQRINEQKRQIIKDHINMFPRLPSHYCRSSSSKEYLERTLSLAKMYELYVEYCKENNFNVEKKWLYYQIFNYEFNIGFHKPKKDLCEICSEYEAKRQGENLNDNLQQKYRLHIEAKQKARDEKKTDVQACKDDETTALICFDMQSVLTCPQTQISKAYYKKKYAVYNLTGYEVGKKNSFCVVWHELMGGRKGADIASALYILLEKVLLERPKVTKFILWSDACVPQNKNSHMSAALLYFLKTHPQMKSIVQKFQVPGHSCVQEVDAMHSVLDRSLSKLELHSPLAIFRAMKNTRSRKPYKLVQMQKKYFLDFKVLSQRISLSNIPYKTLVQISYENNSHLVKYKLTFNAIEPHSTSILKRTTRKNDLPQKFLEDIPCPAVQPLPACLPEDKIEHIRCLSNHFSAIDLQFWKALIPNF